MFTQGDSPDSQYLMSLQVKFNSNFHFSVQFSCSVVSDSLRPHESQHARPPCPSRTPGVHSDSCPSSQWCHPAISSSVVPFSSWPQSLPASESFPMSQLFAWGGQSTGVMKDTKKSENMARETKFHLAPFNLPDSILGGNSISYASIMILLGMPNRKLLTNGLKIWNKCVP